jgi:hypothetical protein
MALGTAGVACTKASGADAVKAYQSVADAVCACPDMACVEKAGQETGKNVDKFKGVKLSDAETAEVAQAGKRASDCMAKLAPPPPAPPPAEAPVDAAGAAAPAPDAAAAPAK